MECSIVGAGTGADNLGKALPEMIKMRLIKRFQAQLVEFSIEFKLATLPAAVNTLSPLRSQGIYIHGDLIAMANLVMVILRTEMSHTS